MFSKWGTEHIYAQASSYDTHAQFVLKSSLFLCYCPSCAVQKAMDTYTDFYVLSPAINRWLVAVPLFLLFFLFRQTASIALDFQGVPVWKKELSLSGSFPPTWFRIPQNRCHFLSGLTKL